MSAAKAGVIVTAAAAAAPRMTLFMAVPFVPESPVLVLQGPHICFSNLIVWSYHLELSAGAAPPNL
jgi:hypothetical protein